MADRTTGELPASEIGDLPLAPDIYDDTLIPVEQQGTAKHISGRQWKQYAVAAVGEETDAAARSAAAAAQSAKEAASSAQSASSSATAAANSAAAAKTSQTAAANSATAAKASQDAAKASQTAAAASQTAAKASETAAAASQTAAKNSENAAAASQTAAANSAKEAAASATAAKNSQTAAAGSATAAAGSASDSADSADKAEMYSGKPPVIRDGYWYTWDADRQEYVETREPARGNLMFAAFEVDPNDGTLYMFTDDEYAGPDFALNGTELEVILNYA